MTRKRKSAKQQDNKFEYSICTDFVVTEPEHDFYLQLKEKRDNQIQPCFFVIFNKNSEIEKSKLDKFNNYDFLETRKASEIVESSNFMFDFESVQNIELRLNDGIVFSSENGGLACDSVIDSFKSCIFAVYRSEIYGSLKIIDTCDGNAKDASVSRFIKNSIRESIQIKEAEKNSFQKTLEKYQRRRRLVTNQNTQYDMAKAKDKMIKLKINDDQKNSRKRKKSAGDAFISPKPKKSSRTIKLLVQFENDHTKSKVIEINEQSSLSDLGFSKVYTFWPDTNYDLDITIEDAGFSDQQVIYVK